ncbi:MAG TPA: helix-hairpin-helix domain-containing protein [Rhabdochlamydiaceae bacterium]|nr:helix-hairpin-helix domain-containing protein [Rhabdochlamydiaceae bacterium]
MDKNEVVAILEEIAILLELQEENPFKIRAYHNAERALLNMEEDLKAMVKKKKLTEVEGIGEHIAEKITILMTKGRLPYYEKLKKATPKGVLEMMEVRGLGAKKIKTIYSRLKIQSLSALKKACLAGKIAKLPGFGKKTEQNILDSLAHLAIYQKRRLWWDAMELAAPILKGFKKIKGVKKAEVAGSLRRRLETIGDLDFLRAQYQNTRARSCKRMVA